MEAFGPPSPINGEAMNTWEFTKCPKCGKDTFRYMLQFQPNFRFEYSGEIINPKEKEYITCGQSLTFSCDTCKYEHETVMQSKSRIK
jgi:DNA-directed RNA polymerase subunit M/transcription elongation factor TFIIS